MVIIPILVVLYGYMMVCIYIYIIWLVTYLLLVGNILLITVNINGCQYVYDIPSGYLT